MGRACFQSRAFRPSFCRSPKFVLIARERGCNSNTGMFLIGQEDRQQCMSRPISTKSARTARKRTIGALVSLRFSENLKEILDNKLLLAMYVVYPMRRLRKDEYLKKTVNLDSARLESQWRVVDSHSAAVCCCNGPMVRLFYKAAPVLTDENKIGGSATSSSRLGATLLEDLSRKVPD